jgi:hypothetical protein
LTSDESNHKSEWLVVYVSLVCCFAAALGFVIAKHNAEHKPAESLFAGLVCVWIAVCFCGWKIVSPKIVEEENHFIERLFELMLERSPRMAFQRTVYWPPNLSRAMVLKLKSKIIQEREKYFFREGDFFFELRSYTYSS